MKSNMLARGRDSIFMVGVRIIGNSVSLMELEDLIRSNWGVHSSFAIKNLGHSFRVEFTTSYDHSRALGIEWT